DDVFANVMHVALDGRHHDPALWLRPPRFFRFHERHQVGDGLFHYTRTLHYLWQKHLSRAKQITDDAHSGHKRTFNHIEWPLGFWPRFLGIDVDLITNALTQRGFQTFFHGPR